MSHRCVNTYPHRTWIEISSAALRANYNNLVKLSNKRCKTLCVVKANAYGHGLMEIVSILEKLNPDYYGVDNLQEALTIRKHAITRPILILGYVPIKQIKSAVQQNISLTIYNKQTLDQVITNSSGKKAKIHLKIETGTNRQGIKLEDLGTFLEPIASSKQGLSLEGISTHFANIEDTLDTTYANLQLKRFTRARQVVKRYIKYPFTSHCAASSAAILNSKFHFDMIRLGIALYGLWPSREVKVAHKPNSISELKLRPVLSWKSIIAQIKIINTAESVGYGRSWYSHQDSKIAVIPIGYSDGYDRKLSNSGEIIIHNKKVKVIGRVAMNMIVVDVTHIPKIDLEDKVTILGNSSSQTVSAESMASKIGTINYEILSRINPRIPRIII